MSSDRNCSYKRQLLLIRHGQYMNESSHDDGIRVLTDVGEEQAKITGEYLWSVFQHFVCNNPSSGGSLSNHKNGIVVAAEPKFIHVSDMTRAKQTAKYILDAFPSHVQNRQVTDPRLRERFPCDPEPPLRHRHAKYSDMRAAEDVFEQYFHRPLTCESSVEIIVGHANVIRYLVCRALQLPPEAWLRISLPHCSITSVIISGNGHVRVSSIGSSGHLPADKVTTYNLP
ncbi:phosphoglycerate mutase-like protein [Trypanosoma vivax Y486]|uniref:Serine/threonine-protein phosphatase PGAM5, mitochondrial n=1 Tax=Trypanosoma vivax (strain Y486) TaxID=1055687 RepID=F9WLX8_TRYVY|nr:phosphoglycerate mutase-like protein [Trypanosoma vivax Y486]|eukprot:CCD18523.1 phosphoglycerate mutase-like protein [Trypanosoma vivax Y486]